MNTTRILFIAIFAFVAFAGEVRATLPLCQRDAAALGALESLRSDIRAGNQAEKKVSVVVPVYREWGNGNLVRLLDNFATQTAAKNQFELVLVVNNTLGARIFRNQAYRENRKTIEALNFVGAGTAPTRGRFTAEEIVQLEVLRGAGLNIRVVDQTGGARLSVNMGKIRDLGFRDVYQRHRAKPENALVATLDADTLVPNDYVESAIVHFTNDRALGAIYLPMDFRLEPGSDRRLYRSTFGFRQYFADAQASDVLINSHRMGGPQLIATAKSLIDVGGVPHESAGEGVVLAQAMQGKTKMRAAPDLRVVTADRARSDGFFAANRLLDIDGEHEIYKYSAHFYEEEIKDKIYRITKDKIGSDAFLLKHMTMFDLPELTRSNLDGPELARFDHLMRESEERHEADVAALRAAVKARYEQIRRGEQPASRDAHEFLDGNTWIDAQLTNDHRGMRSESQMIERFEAEFPEWFLPPARAPNRTRSRKLAVFMQVAAEARMSPDDHPSMMTFLRQVER